MKKWNKIFHTGLALVLLLFIGTIFCSLSAIDKYNSSKNKTYNVEANRVIAAIDYTKLSETEVKTLYNDYFLCIKYYGGTDSNIHNQMINGKMLDFHKEYLVYVHDSFVFVFEYENEALGYRIIYIELASAIIICSVYILFMYILKRRLINPFHKMIEYPYQLAKGNLDLSLEADGDKLFGDYVWGMNALRDTLKENRNTEEELTKEKAMLILSISHDIKTPLSSILLYSQALQKDAIEKNEAADNIINNTNKIKDYVDSLAESYSSKKYNAEISDIYLYDVIGKIKEIYGLKLSILGIDLRFQEFNNIMIKADLFKLLEIYGNLIENSIKYGNGKYISFSFAIEDSCLLTSVHSSGATINKDELDKVFNEFYRGTNSTNKKGSGLGLYICRELIHKMNGDIFVKEENNEFIVTIVNMLA